MIVQAPSQPASEPPITIGPFWPEIDPVKIRDDQRIDNTVTPERLRAVLIESAITTIEALADWKAAQIAAGNTALDTIAAEPIDGTSLLVHRFLRAVGCWAKALLIERYRDYDATAKGDRNADQLVDTISDCRRDYHNAIADIAGRPRTTVELI